MAAVEDEMDDRFKDVDIETLLSRVERRPLTFSRKKSVFSAPEFSQRLKGEETIDEGCDLTLSFKVNGTPRPTLRWFKDDEEVKDHARLTVEEGEDGKYTLTLHQVNKGDEAAYRCRAENSEGACSCCFFLSVKGKPKSPKRDGKKNTHKRTVSFPTMFSTIVEKVEEEETAGKEASKAPVSPLTPFYDSITLRGRLTWQEFLGDWAFVNGGHKARGGSLPPEGRRGVTPAREARARTPETPTTSFESLRMLRAGSPMTFSLTHQRQKGTPLSSLTSLRPRTLCFYSKPHNSEPSESELYRRMLIAHRKGLRHVERPDKH